MAGHFCSKIKNRGRSKKGSKKSPQASAGPASAGPADEPLDQVQPATTPSPDKDETSSPTAIPGLEAGPANSQASPKESPNESPNERPQEKRQESPQATPRERIWMKAYNNVKIKQPEAVEKYETFLYSHLKPTEGVAEGDTDSPRQQQMRQLCMDELKRTKDQANRLEKVHAALELIDSLSEIIGDALKNVPQAAAVWAVVCFSSQLLANPIAETKKNRDGLSHVLSRMKWYWNLTKLLFGEDKSSEELAEIRDDLEDRIVQLYTKLITYQINSVCRYSQNQFWTAATDVILLEDWGKQLKAIQEAEHHIHEDIKEYGSEQTKEFFVQLLKTAASTQKEISLILPALQEHWQEEERAKQDDEDKKCQQDLRATDPSLDKERILDTKGGLLEGSSRWILKHPVFTSFREDAQSRLLWIKGGPGMGKTMLLCGIIDELKKTSQAPVIYFFCQATESRLNNAVAVLRGLIFLATCERPRLIKHVRSEYDPAGKEMFGDGNAWFSLARILTSMVEDRDMQDAVVIIDALDECDTKQSDLIRLIVKLTTLSSSRVKWIVSSRDWKEIERPLNSAQDVKLNLEINEASVSVAIKTYIEIKVGDLTKTKGLDTMTKTLVQNYLIDNANGTFLWAALVFDQLKAPKVASRHILKVMREFPPGLNPLYARMLHQLFQSMDAHLCKEILAISLAVFRPVSLDELGVLMGSANKLQSGDLEEIIADCGSFLTLRKGIVYFIHQSAKDYLKSSDQILPASDITEQHRVLVQRSVEAMSGTLRRDIYKLGHLGVSIDEVVSPTPDPLDSVRYSCVSWIDHFTESGAGAAQNAEARQEDLISRFFKTDFLHWLEALSLLRSIPEGVRAVRKLENHVINGNFTQDFKNLLYDAYRFILAHKSTIEVAPLQVYASALVLSPLHSLTRKIFEKQEPAWFSLISQVEQQWDARLETLEGHTYFVESLAFSRDGRRLASGCLDGTIKFWDTSTSTCSQTCENSDGGDKWVTSLAFSSNDQFVASGHFNGSVRTWNIAAGAHLRTYRAHTSEDGPSINSLVFSPSIERLAAGSSNGLIYIWRLAAPEDEHERTLHGHTGNVRSLAFSLDGSWLFSGSADGKIKKWSIKSGECMQTLSTCPSGKLYTVSMSLNDQRLVWDSDDMIFIWDGAEDAPKQTPKRHQDETLALADSPNNSLLASYSGEAVEIWDVTTGVCVHTLDGVRGDFAFSPEERRLASSENNMIQIWDATPFARQQTLEGHTSSVTCLAFSPNGRWLATGSFDGSVRLWAVETGHCVRTLERQGGRILDLLFSPDDSKIALVPEDQPLKVWGVHSDECVCTLSLPEFFKQNRLLMISPNGQFLVYEKKLSHLSPGEILMWNAATNIHTLVLREWHNERFRMLFDDEPPGIIVRDELRSMPDSKYYKFLFRHPRSLPESKFTKSILFSPDSQRLAVSPRRGWIDIFNTASGERLDSYRIKSGYFSFDEVHDSDLLPRDAAVSEERDHAASIRNDENEIATARSKAESDSVYDMSSDGAWVMKNGRNLLRIQSSLPRRIGIRGDVVAIGCETGRVVIMRFKDTN